MTKRELYEKAYNMLDKITPLRSDCGELCRQACCDSADEEAGMFLFPGEEIMYTKIPDWLRIKESDFTYGKEESVLLAICSERCERALRPLACRIFPLTPYIGDNGVVSIKIDPRAVPLCPLAQAGTSRGLRLEKDFIRAVENVFRLLAEDEEIITYIEALSRLIDEYESIIISFTVGLGKKRRRRAKPIRE
jgi:hypothetical protein